MVDDAPVAGVGLNAGGLLGMGQAHHVHGGVVLQLGLLVVLGVVPAALHLGHLHVVDQQGVVLDAAAANVVALGLLEGQLVLVL